MSKDNTLLILGVGAVAVYLFTRNKAVAPATVPVSASVPSNVTSQGQKSILLPLVNAINPNNVSSIFNSLFKPSTPAPAANAPGFSNEAQQLFNSTPLFQTPTPALPVDNGAGAANFSNEANSLFNTPSFATPVNSFTTPDNNSSFSSSSPTGVDLTDESLLYG